MSTDLKTMMKLFESDIDDAALRSAKRWRAELEHAGRPELIDIVQDDLVTEFGIEPSEATVHASAAVNAVMGSTTRGHRQTSVSVLVVDRQSGDTRTVTWDDFSQHSAITWLHTEQQEDGNNFDFTEINSAGVITAVGPDNDAYVFVSL